METVLAGILVTEVVKNAGSGLIYRQMQQFCPWRHCDVLTTLARTLSGLYFMLNFSHPLSDYLSIHREDQLIY